jgi:hypothetical protein
MNNEQEKKKRRNLIIGISGGVAMLFVIIILLYLIFKPRSNNSDLGDVSSFFGDDVGGGLRGLRSAAMPSAVRVGDYMHIN